MNVTRRSVVGYPLELSGSVAETRVEVSYVYLLGVNDDRDSGTHLTVYVTPGKWDAYHFSIHQRTSGRRKRLRRNTFINGDAVFDERFAAKVKTAEQPVTRSLTPYRRQVPLHLDENPTVTNAPRRYGGSARSLTVLAIGCGERPLLEGGERRATPAPP